MNTSKGVVIFTATKEQISRSNSDDFSSLDAISFLISSQNLDEKTKEKLISKYSKYQDELEIVSAKNYGAMLAMKTLGEKWQELLDLIMKKSSNPGLLDKSDQPELYAYSIVNGVHKYYIFNVFREKAIMKFTEKKGEYKTNKHRALLHDWIPMIQSNDVEDDEIDDFLGDDFNWLYEEE